MRAETVAHTRAKRSNLLPIVIMGIVFGVPFVASVVFYLNPHWLPETMGNRGTLIDPPVDTRSWVFSDTEGKPFDTSPLGDSWVLVVIADSVCSSQCEERAYQLRQIRRATGVERVRVERLMAFVEPPSEIAQNLLREHYPRLPLVVLDRLHPIHALPDTELAIGSIVIIDPMGQAMMSYGPAQSAKEILKDLKHLLKVSQDWENRAGKDERQ